MFSKELIVLFICGVSLHTISCQQQGGQPASSHSVSNNDDELDFSTLEPDDDADTDAFTRLQFVNSVDEFISLLTRNGEHLHRSDIYEDEFDADGKQVISGGGRLASPDNCSPRNTTVRITMEDTESDVAFFPRCTTIERCGGCCSSPNLECVPRYTERVRLKVLKGRVPYPGATHLSYEGVAPVIMERHVTCRVACKLSNETCGAKKIFERRKCKCSCRTYTPCAAPTIWDPEECACKCPRVTECCQSENCALVFNHNTCECELHDENRVAIAASGRVGSDASQQPQAPQNTQPTTTTTTTTTTTASTTTADLCATRRCPPNHTRVISNGICVCRSRSRRRRPRPRARSSGRQG